MKRTVAVLVLGVIASPAASQTPVNDKPNPYQTIEGWAKMPDGRIWGSLSAVDIDKDGVSVWVAERCGANSCVGSPLDPVLKFDKDGKLVKSFGAGIVGDPHGIHVDREGNVWVTDCSCLGGGRGRGGAAAAAAGGAPTTPPPPPTTGHQIHKFSPEGKLLMSLGKPGGGRDTAFFWQPNDVLVAPNGDIFVVDGHSSNATTATARIYKFDKTGKLIRTFGKWGKGTEADKLDQPHAVAMDSRGRLFVADRGNNLLKIYDQDFKLLETWPQFSRISGLWITPGDTLYAADSESGSVSRDSTGARNRSEWTRGIRIGSARTGEVWYFIPDPATSPPSTSAAEGVAVDKNGVVYGAEVGPRALKRYVRKP